MWFPFHLRYECRRRFAMMLARVELHHVQTLDTAGGAIVWKTRRRASRIAVSAGNLLLRMQHAEVEVLKTDDWLRWELAVWSAKNGGALGNDVNEVSRRAASPRVESNGLLVPRLPGEPLSHLLADTTRPISSRLQCVGWALQSLGQLHALSADWGDGLVQPISHGDATAENVMVDISNQSACWIDFDTRHRTRLRAIDRHADDLRALVFSTAYHLPASELRRLSDQLRESYRRREVIAQLRSHLTSDWRRPSTFHLAQAPLPFAADRMLRNALLSALKPDCDDQPREQEPVV